MNVLVIPEDFRTDEFILGPIVPKVFAEIGKPQARVRICRDPLLGGIAAATDWRNIAKIIDKYRGTVQVFLLIVDRDGVESRRTALDELERKAQQHLGAGRVFLAELAWQEIEVWGLAGQHLPKGWSWQEIRAHPHPKETYFLPLARDRELLSEPGQGRKQLGRDAAAKFKRVRSRCPEIETLQRRLAEKLQELRVD